MSEPQHVAHGKVREIYSTSDPNTLLFVASDRVSAFDVIMKNVRKFAEQAVSLSCKLTPYS